MRMEANTTKSKLSPLTVYAFILIVSIKGLSFESKDYTKELKTVECTIFLYKCTSSVSTTKKLENVFVKHYAPNHMPDPKGEWSLKDYNSELHYGIRSKVNQFIYTLVCNYIPNIRILVKAVLQIFCSQSCSYTKCLCLQKGSNSTKQLQKKFKS